MLKEYVDSENSNVTAINVISSAAQKQSEMNCEDIDCEEMNFENLTPLAQNFKTLTF